MAMHSDQQIIEAVNGVASAIDVMFLEKTAAPVIDCAKVISRGLDQDDVHDFILHLCHLVGDLIFNTNLEGSEMFYVMQELLVYIEGFDQDAETLFDEDMAPMYQLMAELNMCLSIRERCER